MRRSSFFAAVAAVVVVAAFLAFRPDKLFVDDVADEALTEAFQTAASSTTVTNSTPTPTTIGARSPVSSVATTTTTIPTTTTTAETEPMAVASGSFFGIDHAAEGTATIYSRDGEYVLRLEDDTDIQNGPDLYVWVTADTDWEAPDEYLDLGKLKGNVGGQNYPLPDEFDPDVYRNVLIWCLRFAVPFAAAELG
jgi:hypothetical protein